MERKTIRMPFLAPTYTPDGVTVMRCTLADHGWLDPATLYMQCLVTNTSATTSSVLVPLTSSINGAFSRARLLSGQLLEDILMYGRVSHFYENLKSRVAQEEVKKLGFANRTIAKDKSLRVMHQPEFGLVKQDKWIPLNFCPLTFEFQLGQASDWLDTGTTTPPATGTPPSAGSPVPNSQSWKITEAFLIYDLCTLDAEIQSSYASILRQGQALNIPYHSTILQSQSLTGPNFTIQVMRNLARLKTVFLAFSRQDEENKDQHDAVLPTTVTRRTPSGPGCATRAT